MPMDAFTKPVVYITIQDWFAGAITPADKTTDASLRQMVCRERTTGWSALPVNAHLHRWCESTGRHAIFQVSDVQPDETCWHATLREYMRRRGLVDEDAALALALLEQAS